MTTTPHGAPEPNRRIRDSLPRFPGFDSLRLLAATAVIYCHAFVILRRPSAVPGLFERVTYDLAEYGVFTFFIISGFLLARSLSANPDPIGYAVNRVLRIVPGFLFYTCVTGLVLGPLLTPVSVSAYFADAETFRMFRWGLDSLADTTLPGLFAYEGPYAAVLNGSLWSLHYEALSYVLLLALSLLLRSAWKVAGTLTALSVLVLASPEAAQRLASLSYTLPFFTGGVLMNAVYSRLGVTRIGALLALIVFLVGAFLGSPSVAFAIAGAYAIVFVGERDNPVSRLVARTGDLSYGLYLFGWPIQQALVQLTGVQSPWLLFVSATAVAAIFAAASFHAVEKHAMEWRRTCADYVRRPIRAMTSWLGGAAGFAGTAARCIFIASAAGILLAQSQWWFVLESVIVLAALSATTFVLSGALFRAVKA